MATTKYTDQKWPVGGPCAGQSLSANGEYVGEQVGTPMQGANETAANADPFFAAHSTVRQGTLMPDAADKNFPAINAGT